MIAHLDETLQAFIFIGFALVLTGVLVRLAFIDLKTFRLPNTLTFPLIGIGLVQAYILKGDFLSGLIGAIVGYVFFVAIEYGFKALRGKPGLGRGDAKLLAAGGAWCGWMALPYILLCASLLGIIAALTPLFKSHEQGWIPFGPFLAIGIFAVWISQPLIGF